MTQTFFACPEADVGDESPTAAYGTWVSVIWGGRIVETIPQPEGSETIVLETPLDYEEMPEAAKYSQGRFIAKSSKLLDPEIYKKGMKITLAGEVIGKETRPLGKAQYTYPVVMNPSKFFPRIGRFEPIVKLLLF